jgi:hypothetical protein
MTLFVILLYVDDFFLIVHTPSSCRVSSSLLHEHQHGASHTIYPRTSTSSTS